MLAKQGDITNNYFEKEFGKSRPDLFCRTGLNSPHEPWRIDFTNYVEDGDSFLDVGCGSGADYEILERVGRKVRYKGVDYSPSLLEGAKTLCPEGEFEVQDINNLTEEDGSWDVVNCRHAVAHCEYYEQPIKELVRVAKKRVILTIHTPFPKNGIDNIHPNPPYSWRNLYAKEKFLKFLGGLPVRRLAFKENHCGSAETFIVLEKL